MIRTLFRVWCGQNAEMTEFASATLPNLVRALVDVRLKVHTSNFTTNNPIVTKLGSQIMQVGNLGPCHLTCIIIITIPLRSLGYAYESDGQVEKQDKYLKRMSGFTRLYAAIIATPPLRGQVRWWEFKGEASPSIYADWVNGKWF